MKTFNSIFVGILLIASFAFTGMAAAADQSICTGIDKDFIGKHVPFLFTDIVEKKPVEGMNLCMVILSMFQGGNAAVYVPPSKDSVIAGEIFHNKEGYSLPIIKNIDQHDFQKYEVELRASVALTYIPKGTPKGYVYMVTDPDCPYCERAKEPVKQFADENGLELRVIFYPLPMHPDAKNKAIKGICGLMTFDDYLKNNFSGDLCAQGIEKINRAMEITKKMGITGTPTFIGSKGQKIPGFSPQQFKSLI